MEGESLWIVVQTLGKVEERECRMCSQWQQMKPEVQAVEARGVLKLKVVLHRLYRPARVSVSLGLNARTKVHVPHPAQLNLSLFVPAQ